MPPPILMPISITTVPSGVQCQHYSNTGEMGWLYVNKMGILFVMRVVACCEARWSIVRPQPSGNTMACNEAMRDMPLLCSSPQIPVWIQQTRAEDVPVNHASCQAPFVEWKRVQLQLSHTRSYLVFIFSHGNISFWKKIQIKIKHYLLK